MSRDGVGGGLPPREHDPLEALFSDAAEPARPQFRASLRRRVMEMPPGTSFWPLDVPWGRPILLPARRTAGLLIAIGMLMLAAGGWYVTGGSGDDGARAGDEVQAERGTPSGAGTAAAPDVDTVDSDPLDGDDVDDAGDSGGRRPAPAQSGPPATDVVDRPPDTPTPAPSPTWTTTVVPTRTTAPSSTWTPSAVPATATDNPPQSGGSGGNGSSGGEATLTPTEIPPTSTATPPARPASPSPQPTDSGLPTSVPPATQTPEAFGSAAGMRPSASSALRRDLDRAGSSGTYPVAGRVIG